MEIDSSLLPEGTGLRAMASNCMKGNLGWRIGRIFYYESDQALEQVTLLLEGLA